MKKTKIISIVLAALMVIGMIPFAVLPAGAAETTATPTALPTAYPDGSKFGKTEMFVDVSTITTASHTDRGTIAADGELLAYTTANGTEWGRNRLTTSGTTHVALQNSAGATGIMFYLDNGTSTSGFNLSFQVGTNRGGDMYFDAALTHYIGDGPQIVPKTLTYYVDSGNGWVEKSIDGNKLADSTNKYYFIGGETGANWYYIPFESFFYHGSWNVGDNGSAKTYDPLAYGIDFATFRDSAANAGGAYLKNIQLKAQTPANRVIKLGDLYFTYPEADTVPSDTAATVPYMPGMTKQNHENAGNSTSTVSNGAVTITGDTGNNAVDKSDNRVWLSSATAPIKDITAADGIRFHVDASAVSDTDLLLRLRLKEGVNANALTDLKLYGSTANATTAPTSGSNVQYVLRSAASVVYIKENGAWEAYFGSKTVDSSHGDVIAIPAGYVGEVYIPMDSFYCSLGSWGSSIISWDAALAAGLGKKMDLISIVQTYEAPTANVADYSVTYSDFQIVYADVQLTEERISVGSSVAMKVFAATSDGATVESATFTLGDDTTSRTASVVANATKGGYEVVCGGILAEEIAKDINITVVSKQGAVTLTNKYTTSVVDYCLALIASSESNEAKNVAADLIRYADAAQLYATEELVPNDPVMTNTVSTVIPPYGNIPNFPSNDASVLGNSTAEGYAIGGKELRLDGALAFKINVTVPEGGEAKIGYSIDGAEEAFVNVADGAALFAVGATELDKTIVVKLYVGEATEAAQTLTFTLTDYFAAALADTAIEGEQADLIEAIYTYCYSTDAYVESLSSN